MVHECIQLLQFLPASQPASQAASVWHVVYYFRNYLWRSWGWSTSLAGPSKTSWTFLRTVSLKMDGYLLRLWRIGSLRQYCIIWPSHHGVSILDTRLFLDSLISTILLDQTENWYRHIVKHNSPNYPKKYAISKCGINCRRRHMLNLDILGNNSNSF